jgi:nitrilase
LSPYPSYKVAAAHAAPVFLDTPATVDKACSLITEAAGHGAELIAFPEAYIPAFPNWCALRAPIRNHELFCRLAEGSLLVPGPQISRICRHARKFGVFVSMGFNERSPASVGCIWNANVLIGDDGAILNHHRKLVPTYYEKLVWANGDGAGLRVCETRLGHIGMLICGENTNPLARFTLMAQGEQVHIASFPGVWPSRLPQERDTYDLAHAIRLRAAAHAFEAKAFNVVVSGFMDSAVRDQLAALAPDAGAVLDATPRAVSVVMGPTGEPVSETLADAEGLLYCDLDLNACVEPKQMHDVSGGYNRFDIFKLTVDRTSNRPIRFACEQQEPTGMPPQMKNPPVCDSEEPSVEFEEQ